MRCPESTVSLSVVRANNGAAATAFRVMCADVIRLAAVCAGCHQTNWAFWELLLMHAFEGSCHWDVTWKKEVIVLSYYLTNCIIYFRFSKPRAYSCEVSYCLVLVFMVGVRKVALSLFFFLSTLLLLLFKKHMYAYTVKWLIHLKHLTSFL